jgi:hypothetical protein
MVLINGIDSIKRKFDGRSYTLEETSGTKKTCLDRVKYLASIGHTYRIIKKKSSHTTSGYKYLLYVSDTIQVSPMDWHSGHPNPRPTRRGSK